MSILLGCEVPRVWTPPLRPLTPRTSLGFAFVEFARDVVGMELLPWQRWLAVHALELLPDGTPRFRTILLLVARQSGKSTFLQLLALFFLYVRGVRLVIGTAQNLDIAEEVWQGAVDLAEEVPELAAEVADVVKTNGKKALRLKQGERYKVQAASRRGGRGLSGDLVMLDELREHQTWDAWGAVTKTTMARAHAQVWGVSNAGDAASVVLAFLRASAHRSLGNPDGLDLDALSQVPAEIEGDDDDTLGIFEWSAEPGCDIWDRLAWAQANPSMGHTITERAIASAARTDPDAVFRTEVLCQWVETLTAPALDLTAWLDLTAPHPAPKGGVLLGVSADPDQQYGSIALGFRRPDGTPHVALAAWRPGVGWLPAEVARLRAKLGARVLVDVPLRGLVPGTEVTPQQVAQAHNRLAQLVTDGALSHDGNGPLDTAVGASRWRDSGDSRVVTRRGGTDVTPLLAAALAVPVRAAAPPPLSGAAASATAGSAGGTSGETAFLASASF